MKSRTLAELERRQSSIYVFVQILDSGKFFLFGEYEDGTRIAPEELAFTLFAHFPGNAYGALCDTDTRMTRRGVWQGVLLCAADAVVYFSGRYENRMISVMWEEGAASLFEVGPRIREVLQRGAFVPRLEAWKSGIRRWRALQPGVKQVTADSVISEASLHRLNGQEQSRYEWHAADEEAASTLFAKEEAQQSASGTTTDFPGGGNQLFDDWLSACVEELIGNHDSVAASWKNVEHTHPLVITKTNSESEQRKWSNEIDWLAELGWMAHPVPFRVCLRLEEPSGPTDSVLSDAGSSLLPIGENGLPSWTLRVVLQDKQDEGRIVLYDHAAESVRVAGMKVFPCDSISLPSEWLPFADWVEERIAECIGLVPWLRDEIAAEPPELQFQDEAKTHPPRLRHILTSDEAWRFLTEASGTLSLAGYSVLLPMWWEQVRKMRTRLKAKVTSSVGAPSTPLFGLEQTIQFDWRIAVGDTEVTEDEYRQLAMSKTRLVRLRGQWIQVDPTFLSLVRKTINRMQKQNGLTFREALEMHLLGGTAGHLSGDNADADSATDTDNEVEATAGEGKPNVPVEIELNAYLTELVTQMQDKSLFVIDNAPTGFYGQLRPYQQRGFSWLSFMRRFGFGAILADDMGLGKTVQYIAYLLEVLSSNTSECPSLLVCPTSVLGNWQKELERFAPGLRVYVHHGANRKRGENFCEEAGSADLVLTSYTLAYMDRDDLQGLAWDSVCLDEAQNIKNARSKQSVAVRGLQARHRIAMTGTPMENRLTELWSIFDFVNPGYLGGLARFTRRFVNPIERTGDSLLMRQVQRLVQPFLLRRVKSDPTVDLDLPEKVENKVFVELTVEQAALYEGILADMMERIDIANPMERRGLILATLTRLKQVCNHPGLAVKEQEIQRVLSGDNYLGSNAADFVSHLVEQSGKLVRFVDMVKELREQGDKCLVFTQFVETGKLLRAVLETMLGEPILFLHGSTSKAKRDKMIAEFGEGGSRTGVFILSLKAGGVGLNLTAANHVFHFDRWWNPAVENQATDRAYRIGQHRHVLVHKFVALGTVEERIDELIDRKFSQSEEIIGAGEQWITEMSTDELKNLFTLRREWVEQ